MSFASARHDFDTDRERETFRMTGTIVSSYVSNNRLSAADLPGVISAVHASLAAIGEPPAPAEPELQPAVPVRSSIRHDHIVCLEDGKKLKMLKRYLRTNYNMTPEDYRAKWKLPRDYPMVCPAYATQRRELAVTSGLGRKAKG